MAPPQVLIFTTIATLVLAAIPIDSHAADVDSRAYVNESCIIADEPFLLPESDDDTTARMAPIFGLFVGKLANALISGIIQGVGGGLERQSARKDTQYVTAKNFSLYIADLSQSPYARVNPQFGCATIVTGTFHPASFDCTQDYIPREVSAETAALPEADWVTNRTDDSIENILKRANICLIDEVRSMLEARIVVSDDGTAYRLDSAGYRINSLLSTNSTKAKRNLFYTTEVVEPSGDTDGRVLSMALIDLGQVTAGDSSAGDIAVRSEWLQVPQMSSSARKAYQADTAIHQEVFGKIEALERTIARDTRQLAGIEERAQTVSPDIQAALAKEMTKIGVRLVTSESLLDAWRAEYGELAGHAANYMPVTIRFGITETRSQRKAMQAIGDLLKANSKMLANTATDMMGIERSLDAAIEEQDIDDLRTGYFDALVALELESPQSNAEEEQLRSKLELAKRSYNTARIAVGLPPVN